MALYEHTVIARPDLSAQQAQALADTFTEILKGQGGEVSKVEYWGLRNLVLSDQEEPQGPLPASQHQRGRRPR